jgi:SAM-dependent methyltransferase
MDPMTSINSCEVCGNSKIEPVIDLGSHPMCDDLVPIGSDRRCREYPIEILFCPVCRTAHQRFQVPKRDLFPSTYHYRSRFTADVLNGMAGLVESCEDRFGILAGRRVLDIGCNDGSLLGFFRAKGGRTFGIEPTGAADDAKEQGHVIYQDFLSERLAAEITEAHGAPDIIVFTNVFAHIENLQEVLAALRQLMKKDTALVIENHYLGSIFDGNQFDTFYHEHPRTYSYTSFVHIARVLETTLSGVEFPSRYGGNIRVFLGGPRNQSSVFDPTELDAREVRFEQRFAELRENMRRWVVAKGEFISDAVRRHGPLRAKAFPGRAAILMKLLSLDRGAIEAVHEKPGSMKIGHYIPGTRVPILSDDDLFATADRSKPVLNLAWHIAKEIRGYLAQQGYQGTVVDIVEPGDFAPQP